MDKRTSILILTWNVGNKSADKAQLPEAAQLGWLSSRAANVDAVIVGLQEAHPSLIPLYRERLLGALNVRSSAGTATPSTSSSAKPGFACNLSEHAATYFPLFVFTQSRDADAVSSNLDPFSLLRPLEVLRYTPVKDPILGTEHSSKGCVLASFRCCDNHRLTVANCHWQHAYTGLGKRLDMQRALQEWVTAQEHETQGERGVGDLLLQIGDLNFRVIAAQEVTKEPTVQDHNSSEHFQAEFDSIVEICEAGRAPKELFSARDQLSVARLDEQEPAFKGFEEMPVGFQPTYKRKRSEDGGYDRVEPRLPGWCDRILWKKLGAGSVGTVKGLEYTSIEEVKYTDHKPVVLVIALED